MYQINSYYSQYSGYNFDITMDDIIKILTKYNLRLQWKDRLNLSKIIYIIQFINQCMCNQCSEYILDVAYSANDNVIGVIYVTNKSDGDRKIKLNTRNINGIWWWYGWDCYYWYE